MQALGNPKRRCVGVTSDVHRRVTDHNHGKSLHASSHRPWRLVASIRFEAEDKARRFERYLKIGSGRAFASRYSWQ
jgi:predicted GIY-YIG superfamily endonuclease